MITLNGFTPEQMDDIAAELRLGWQRKAVEAEMRRRDIAAINAQDNYWRDDMVVTMRMDPVVNLYWKMREGNNVWEDDFHRKYFKKHFPEVFTKPKAPRTKLGWSRTLENGHKEAQEGTKNGAALVDRTGCALAQTPEPRP